MILAANLNWIIFLNYNPFNLDQLRCIQWVSFFAPIFYTVLICFNYNVSRSSKSQIHFIRKSSYGLFSSYLYRKYWMNKHDMIDLELPSLQTMYVNSRVFEGIRINNSCSLSLQCRSLITWNDDIRFSQDSFPLQYWRRILFISMSIARRK